LGIETDLSNIKAIGNIIHQTTQEFKKIDILINNAGIIRRADTIDFSEKDWDDVMAVNLKTVFFFPQAVAKQFIKQKTGRKIVKYPAAELRGI
jgi:2-deoxy-D-gluconate 3-dehydrogenase